MKSISGHFQAMVSLPILKKILLKQYIINNIFQVAMKEYAFKALERQISEPLNMFSLLCPSAESHKIMIHMYKESY